MKQQPTIIVQNNSAAIVPVSLFTTAAGGAAGSVNARTAYSWDVTSQLYLQTNVVTIQAKVVAAVSFVNYQVRGNFQNAGDVVAALNTLNIGQFYVYNSLGNTFIAVLNDAIVYGDLAITSTLGFTVQWQINFIFPVIPPFNFDVKDLTNGSAIVYSGPVNQASGSAFIAAPDAVPGHDYLFEAGWPFDGFHGTTNTLFRNSVQVQQTTMFDIFGACDDVLPAYGVTYLLVVDVTS